MFSLKAWIQILGYPLKYIYTILVFPFSGGTFPGKYQTSLRQTLKLLKYRAGLSLPITDAWILSRSTSLEIIHGVARSHPHLTRNLNNFGKSYDDQSYWLVEAPHRGPHDPIIVYLHGGGFVHQTKPQQVETVLAIYHLLDEAQGARTSILHLDYKLACHGYTVPTQLYQLSDVYEKLTVRDGNSNIVLMGDSAGGVLAVSFLQYLKRHPPAPSPSSSTPDGITWPAALVLISPWMKIFADAYQFQPGWSIYDNKDRDIVPYRPHTDTGRRRGILGDYLSAADLLISPGNLKYNVRHWYDIPTLNQNSVFVILGEHEVFVDDILEWCRVALPGCDLKRPRAKNDAVFDQSIHEYRNEQGNGHLVDVVIEPWGVHVGSLFFENVVSQRIKKDEFVQASDLDRDEFFGVVRIVEFLNRTL
ncbi:uncharacterized protein LODBEIA_P55630 [Lodderomyces beijingensis]|uniref:Alpha/beta hydrolase fold-3 domain-containing protein n=1 Tax=Lodderomyces beijingensis TaxID=1775926 RepID=A0ABP0ZT69_9ASCO